MHRGEPMPLRGTVDAQFDGHAERTWRELDAVEKLDWLWACMQLLNGAARRLPRDELASRSR